MLKNINYNTKHFEQQIMNIPVTYIKKRTFNTQYKIKTIINRQLIWQATYECYCRINQQNVLLSITISITVFQTSFEIFKKTSQFDSKTVS